MDNVGTNLQTGGIVALGTGAGTLLLRDRERAGSRQNELHGYSNQGLRTLDRHFAQDINVRPGISGADASRAVAAAFVPGQAVGEGRYYTAATSGPMPSTLIHATSPLAPGTRSARVAASIIGDRPGVVVRSGDFHVPLGVEDVTRRTTSYQRSNIPGIEPRAVASSAQPWEFVRGFDAVENLQLTGSTTRLATAARGAKTMHELTGTLADRAATIDATHAFHGKLGIGALAVGTAALGAGLVIGRDEN